MQASWVSGPSHETCSNIFGCIHKHIHTCTHTSVTRPMRKLLGCLETCANTQGACVQVCPGGCVHAASLTCDAFPNELRARPTHRSCLSLLLYALSFLLFMIWYLFCVISSLCLYSRARVCACPLLQRPHSSVSPVSLLPLLSAVKIDMHTHGCSYTQVRWGSRLHFRSPSMPPFRCRCCVGVVFRHVCVSLVSVE